VSIEVQCPNPRCAKVHRVKNRWAGKRGTCPDCGTIIQVPLPSAASPPPLPAGKADRTTAEVVATVSDEMPPQALEFALPQAPEDETATLVQVTNDSDSGWDHDPNAGLLASGLETTLADDEFPLPAPPAAKPLHPRWQSYLLAIISLLLIVLSVLVYIWKK
jgi:hypothetical protein